MAKKEKDIINDQESLIKELYKKIDLESLSNAVSQETILPPLKIELNEIKTMEVIGNFRFFKSKFGNTFCFDVLFENMKHNLVVPESLKFQLIVAMIKKNLTFIRSDGISYPDFNKLIGNIIVVKSAKGNTKEYKDVKLYAVEIK